MIRTTKKTPAKKTSLRDPDRILGNYVARLREDVLEETQVVLGRRFADLAGTDTDGNLISRWERGFVPENRYAADLFLVLGAPSDFWDHYGRSTVNAIDHERHPKRAV